MRKAAFAWLAFLVGSALVFTTGGCGNGDGTTMTGDLFSGTYCWQAWSGNVTGPQATAQWGTVSPNGMGMVTAAAIRQNRSGVVSSPAFTPYTYGVGPGNTLGLNTVGTPQGGISADGAVAVLAASAGGNLPTFAVLLKKATGFSLASLNGGYHAVGFLWNGTNEIAYYGGTATFDGGGNTTGLSLGANQNGAITPPGPPVPGEPYTVEPDGAATWMFAGRLFRGGISPDGEIAVFSGVDEAFNGQGIFVFIRATLGGSAALLSGAYHTLALLASNTPPPRYITVQGMETADGVGMLMRGARTTNSDGVVVPSAPNTTTYGVAANGALAIGAGVLLGGVSPSGRYAAVAGTTTGGAAGLPTIQILIR